MKLGFFSTASAIAFSVAVTFAAPAQAGTITVYQGQDDGSAVEQALSTYTNSYAAFQSFLTSLQTYGIEDRHGLGNITNTFPSGGNGNGFHDSLFHLGGNSGNPLTAQVNYTATSTNFGAQLSGFNTTTLGNLYGFGVGNTNTTWLGFPGGSATVNLVNPTNAFGLWLTGLEGTAYSDVITVSFDDGVVQSLFPLINDNGGAQFFGFTDTSSFSSVTLSINNSSDAWGVDVITYDVPSSATPIPAALPLFTTGLGVMGLLGWRRKKKAAALAA
jgi:hypothetical protein